MLPVAPFLCIIICREASLSLEKLKASTPETEELTNDSLNKTPRPIITARSSENSLFIKSLYAEHHVFPPKDD